MTSIGLLSGGVSRGELENCGCRQSFRESTGTSHATGTFSNRGTNRAAMTRTNYRAGPAIASPAAAPTQNNANAPSAHAPAKSPRSGRPPRRTPQWSRRPARWPSSSSPGIGAPMRRGDQRFEADGDGTAPGASRPGRPAGPWKPLRTPPWPGRRHCIYVIEDVEALLKRQRQQQTGQQLHTGLHDPQLLQQTGPIAVQPFGFGFGASGAIPLLIVSG